MLKIAIIGCGRIADSHVQQIHRIRGCEIVGVCDREPLMARQLSERFQVKHCYDDVDQLLGEAKPDVVHITTPPQSHFDLARECLRRGSHVYVEKPFTLDTREAEDLIQLAQDVGRKITVGHDDQFSHAARRLRALAAAGYLGGPPIHMESHYCYALGNGGSYSQAFLGDENHWVRRLPGQLLHNVISHGIARLAEYFTTAVPLVIAHGFTSPAFRRLGEGEMVDELRVLLYEDGGPTGYFTFSSQMRPSLHQFRIFGHRNGLMLDQDNETLIRLPGRRRKSYLEHFVAPLESAGEYLRSLNYNARRFLARDFHMKSGMKFLIEGFYRSIMDGWPLPISYDEILRTTRTMDAIFEQLRAGKGAGGQTGADERFGS